MAGLEEFRQQYPMYNDMPDAALADAIYTKFYTDIPRSEFNEKLFGKPKNIGLGKALEGSTIGAVIEGITAPGRALQGDYNAEPPQSPGFISETDIARQRMAATRMADDATKLAGVAMLGNTGAPAGALGTGTVRPKPAVPVQVPQPTVTPDELIKAGGEGFNRARAAADKIDPNDALSLVHRTRTKLENAGLPDEPTLGGPAHARLNRLETDANRAATEVMGPTQLGPPIPVQQLSAPDMVAFRQSLTNASKQEGSPGHAAGLAKGEFDDWLRATAPNLAKELDDAVANTRIGHLAADIAKATNRAGLSADAANSGMNMENRLRQVFVPLLAKEEDKLMRGRRTNYDATIHGLLRDLVEGSPKDNFRRMTGNVLGGGGGLGAAAYGLTGVLSNPVVATLPVIGAIVKSFGNRATLAKVNEISRLVISSAPLTRAQAAQINAEVNKAIAVINKSKISEVKKAAMLQALQRLLTDRPTTIQEGQ